VKMLRHRASTILPKNHRQRDGFHRTATALPASQHADPPSAGADHMGVFRWLQVL